MIEPTVTAEDLTLYALDLLDGEEQNQVDAMLRKSTAAREELGRIRGDLALFALATEQHTPQALTRQRLLKQVARERRTVPVEVPVQDERGRVAAHTFAADRAENGTRASAGGTQRTKREQPPTPDPSLTDPVADPQRLMQSGVVKTPPTRAFPSRSQQMRAAAQTASIPSVPRVVQEPEAFPPDGAPTFSSDALSAGATSFASDTTVFSAERPTFSPDPQVFPREARSMVTSATAHSVTMFEQHFAADAVAHPAEQELPPDPDAYSGRRRKEYDDAVASVQDRFVPSVAAERTESFAFSSYRDLHGEEPGTNQAGRWLNWTGWAVAAAVALAAAVAWRDDFGLREQVSRQEGRLSAAEGDSARAEAVLQTLQSPSSQHFLLGRTDAAPGPSGRVVYLPERGTMVFQGSSLETLQPYKTYELWLIPAGEGRQPVSAGLFKPDGHGYATVVLPQMAKGVIAGNFGVTIEDEGGSATPTLPVVLVGAQL